jgi:hypothetical protein
VNTFDVSLIVMDPWNLTFQPTFKLTVYDFPKFMTPVPKATMDLPLYQITTYALPLFPSPSDQPLVISHPLGGLPAFAKVNGLVYSFEPKLKSHLGVYTIQGIVTNSKYSLSTSYTLKVSVTNSAPQFDGALESVSVT